MRQLMGVSTYTGNDLLASFDASKADTWCFQSREVCYNECLTVKRLVSGSKQDA
jgi:hypothetical protein